MPTEVVPPSGTVTFLFTDVEESTALWERYREDMEEALARHDAVVRREVGKRSGYVFSTGGDGFGIAFSRADDAVAAAVAIQRRLAVELEGGLSLRVRMGLHTGEAQERDSNYFGPALNCAARVMSLAQGGQVLVSQTTAQVVGDRLGEGVGLGAPRQVDLRGVVEPMVVQSVVLDGVEHFSEVEAADRARAVLPRPRTAWFGRAGELDAVLAGLGDDVLVTIIGIGGVGKTRLAVEVASRVDGFADGVRFVDLSGVGSADRVDEEVARALGVVASPGVGARDAVVEWLRRRHLLLVVDNCEHVLDGAASLIGSVLDVAGGVRVLATSREPLLIDGERLMPLGALEVTDERGGPGPGVEMFVDRARRIRPDLENLDGDPAVVELCRRLDGIPLALELAAAKLSSLRPIDIVQLLDERFRLLTGGRRGALERHQTLRAAVAWSYDLLDDRSRTVFDRLSVFSARFDLADALSVCSDGEIGEYDIVEALVDLADKSMLEVGDDPPYRLLETLATFGRERLVARGELESSRRCHAEHYLGLAQCFRADSVGPLGSRVAEAMRARTADFRAAVLWAVEAGETETAVDIVKNLHWPGILTGWTESTRWISALPDSTPSPTPRWGPDLMFLKANAAGFFEGDLDVAERHARQALELNPVHIRAHTHLAHFALARGQPAEVVQHATEAHELAARSDDPVERLTAAMYLVIGNIAMNQPEAAYTAASELFDLADRTQSQAITGFAHFLTGRAVVADDGEAARGHFEESLKIGRAIDNAYLISSAERDLAGLDLDTDPELASARYLRLLQELLDLGDLANCYRGCQHAATALAVLGEHEVAATVLGKVGLTAMSPMEARRFRATETLLREALGPRYDEAVAAGAKTSIGELIDRTIETLSMHAAPSSRRLIV